MWKYVSRRFRDTFERSANHFDKRSTTNVVNQSTNVKEDRSKQCSGPPCCIQWFRQRKCWNDFKSKEENTNNNDWNFEQLNRTWIGAITWSSALALGWYTSQFIHMKIKHHLRDERKCLSVNNLLETLRPYVNSVNKGTLTDNSSKLKEILAKFTPTVHLVANDHSTVEQATAASNSSSTSNKSSDSDLGDVLNSIENRLGLAAIQNGQHQAGLNLLRSAANRHHPPAIFNLGVCYENGLGVSVDEKMAMELFKSAAALHHPGALYNLGIYYGQGRAGLPQDQETAMRLLRLAAVQGQQEAIETLKSMDVEVQPPQTDADLSWKPHNLLMEHNCLVPSPSALFVDNNLFSNSCHETTVF